MCPKRVTRQYFVECGSDEDDDADGKRIICNIRTFGGEPMKESVVVNQNTLNFEIDTGSAVTIIPERSYETLFSNHKLQPSTLVLQSYNGGHIDTLGTLKLPFSYRNMTHNITVYVVKGRGPLLLGRDFVSKFKLKLCPVNYCETDLRDITSKYPKLFSNQLGCFKNSVVELKVKNGTNPVFCRSRPLPFALRQQVEQEINRLVTLGILVPVQYSEYASPVVPVLKQDKSIRLCADYSVSLNKHLLVEKYPLPRMDELFAKLSGGQQFSKLDLSRAYNQVRLSDDSQLLTTINTHKGLYKYTRLVFGLASAPAIFQRTMETLLAGLDGVLVYLDDILVTGKNKSEHVKRLHEVFSRLEQAGLVLQKEKCSFFQDSVSYLGFIVDKQGIHKSPEKVKAILKAKVPSNVTELKSFLGLVNYYRNFVKNASSILSPLHELLQRNSPWSWSKQHDKAVTMIKRELASEKNLAHFNPDSKLILTVDASPRGLGAILSTVEGGVEKPISYASRSLSAAEKRYSQIQKEATAIIFGIRKYHQYLYGRDVPFILRTDHKPLLSIFNPDKGVPEVSANRLQRYAIFLSAYNYCIEYVSSSRNTADYLSRASLEEPVSHTDDAAVDGASYVHFVCEGDRFLSLSEIKTGTCADELLSQVKLFVLGGWPTKVGDSKLKPYFDIRSELAVEDDLLVRGHKVVIPSSLRKQIIDELHKGHLGVQKMKSQARDRFWWPRLSADIEQCVAACSVCCALRRAPARAPLTPWPFPPRSWYRVHIDLAGPINGKTFLVVVDAYSKWVECFDVSNGYHTRVIIEKLCEVMSRFGVFHTICSDNGTYFVSTEFNDFCTRNGIKHVTSPVYNPASNGQCEIYVRIIKRAIKGIILSETKAKDFNLKLQEFLFHYRNSEHSTTDRSPSELIFGRKLRSRLDLIDPQSSSTSDATLDAHVKEKQCAQTEYYHGNREVTFTVGEIVLVRISDNRKKQWVKGTIAKKLGTSVYIVHLNDSNRSIKKHRNQILKYKGEEERKEDGEEAPSASATSLPVFQPLALPPVLLAQPPTPAHAATSTTGESGASIDRASEASDGNDADAERWLECEPGPDPDARPAGGAETAELPAAEDAAPAPDAPVPGPSAQAQPETTTKRPRNKVDYRKFF